MINNDRYFRKLIMTLIILVVLFLAWHTLHILMLIFLSVIFGVFLRKSGAWIAAVIGIGTRWGISIVLLVITVFIIGAGWVTAPRIADQVQALIEQLPTSIVQLRDTFSQIPFFTSIMNHLPSLESIIGSIGGFMHEAAAWLYTAFGATTGCLIIIALGIYFAYGAPLYVHGIVKLASTEHRSLAGRTLDDIGETLYWWLIGRLIAMVIIGVLTVVGLWLLDMPLALTLGLFAAAMSFIPNIGPVIALIPAVLLALEMSWAKGAYVVLVYTGIQLVESYVITPLVQRRTISMPPGLIISAQIIMGVMQGLLGVLVATPLTAVIIVLTQRLYLKEDQAEDHDIPHAEVRAEAGTGDAA